jgi:hypothetical protein
MRAHAARGVLLTLQVNTAGVTNMSSQSTARSLKERAMEELRMYWVIAVYLAVMLAALTWYRRLVLAESGVSYFHYWVAVIEALIFAKVILIGQALGLGRRFEGSRLIMSVLFKSLIFSTFMALFTVIEHLIEGLVHREPWGQIAAGLVRIDKTEILARTVMMIVTLIPFFAFWEVDRIMGEHRLFQLFFRKRSA